MILEGKAIKNGGQSSKQKNKQTTPLQRSSTKNKRGFALLGYKIQVLLRKKMLPLDVQVKTYQMCPLCPYNEQVLLQMFKPEITEN